MPERGLSAGAAGPARSALLPVLVGVALVVVTIAVYWPVGGHGFLTYDDDVYVATNSRVRQGLTASAVTWAFTSVEHCNWHPVTWLSHLLDVQLFGMDPRGHHLMSVGIHCAAALLLFALLLRLTGALWRSSFVAALFALHPLHVESVAWVAERKDVLSAALGFLALLFYARYAEAKRDRARRSRPLYLLTLAMFLLGLMAKPMLVTLPVVMLLLDYWPLRRSEAASGRGLLSLVTEKVPFFAGSLLSSAVTVYAQRQAGAVVALDWIPFAARVQNALVSYLVYLGKTVWPRDLAVLYPFTLPIPLWQVCVSAVVLLLVSVAAIRLGRRRPYLPVGWFWFLVTLIPVIGLVQVGNQAMADRYTYLPSVGLFIMVAWGVPSIRVPVGTGTGFRAALSLLAATAVIALAVAARVQVGYWRDDITLYRRALAVTSNNFVITYNLGVAYGRAGNRPAALAQFRAASALRPGDNRVRNLLAATLADNGEIGAALDEFRRSLALNPADAEARAGLDYWSRRQ